MTKRQKIGVRNLENRQILKNYVYSVIGAFFFIISTFLDKCKDTLQCVPTILFFLIILNLQKDGQLHAQEKYELECPSYLIELAHDSLVAQIGIKELTGNNDGEVEKYLKSVGLGKGYPYCVSALYWGYWVNAKQKSDIPFKRTALAQGQFNFAKKTGKKVPYRAEKHDWLIWRLGTSSSGHGEVVDSVLQGWWIKTIGFNTSNGLSGSKREGNGVYPNKRNLVHVLGRLIPKGLIGVKPRRDTLQCVRTSSECVRTCEKFKNNSEANK